jgi:hypothetical protein
MDKQELDLAIRELIADIQNTRALCRQMGERASLPASRWKEEQSIPTPIRSRQLCYSCKVPWEPDHRCRGKGKRHIIEMHYDSEDEEVHGDATIDSYLEQFEELVTLAHLWRLVTLAHLGRIVTLAHWRDSWMDRMIAPVL